jgi:Holliday junction resolvase RusA-like endonuclease
MPDFSGECKFSIADILAAELGALTVARFTVPGTPKSWERPRRNAKTGSFFTPKTTLDAEANVAAAFRVAYPDWGAPVDVVSFGLVCMFRLPDGRGRDTDNMLKVVMDGLNKALWLDDRQVAETTTRVDAYSAMPGTGVVVYRCRDRGAKPKKCPKG